MKLKIALQHYLVRDYAAEDMYAVLKKVRKWVVVERDMPSLGKTPMKCAKLSIDYLKLLHAVL